MNFDRFARTAGLMYDDIPEAFRAGVVGVAVEEEAKSHPTLPGIWTLGECVTEHWPDPTGGVGDTRSEILLYYGSFGELAVGDPRFDWEAELWETMLHELLHHREAAADEESLDVFDWAVDQNYRRLAGLDFDPFFPRYLPTDEVGQVRLDGETFVGVVIGPTEDVAEFQWREGRWSIRLPREASILWARVRNLAGGRLWVVVERRRPWWSRIVRRHGVELWEMDRRALPVPIREA
jgi:hypothetical protein